MPAVVFLLANIFPIFFRLVTNPTIIVTSFNGKKSRRPKNDVMTLDDVTRSPRVFGQSESANQNPPLEKEDLTNRKTAGTFSLAL